MDAEVNFAELNNGDLVPDDEPTITIEEAILRTAVDVKAESLERVEQARGMRIENAEAAAKSLGIEYSLEKVTEINEIMKFGVMMTPALAVDGQVKVVGKVPDEAAIKAMLK